MAEENKKPILLASLKVEPAWVKLGPRYGWVTRRVPFGPNKKMHWAVRHKWTNAWKHVVLGAVLENRRKLGKIPLERPTVEIILSAIKIMDRDNAYAACKPIIDGLKIDSGAKVLIDDNEEHLELVVKQTKVSKVVEEGVTINIYK